MLGMPQRRGAQRWKTLRSSIIWLDSGRWGTCLPPCPPPLPVPTVRGKGSFHGPDRIKPGRELRGDWNQAPGPGPGFHALDVDEAVPDALPSDRSRFIRTESAEKRQGNPRRQPRGVKLGEIHQAQSFLGRKDPVGDLVGDRGLRSRRSGYLADNPGGRTRRRRLPSPIGSFSGWRADNHPARGTLPRHPSQPPERTPSGESRGRDAGPADAWLGIDPSSPVP